MRKSLKKLTHDTEELYRIRANVMFNPLNEIELKFLDEQVKEGCPLGELLLCYQSLIHENNKERAVDLFEKYIKHANGGSLFDASMDFAFLSDFLRDFDMIDWSIRCLKRSAWRQFLLAKAMWSEMKKHPFKFPEA